MIGASWGALLTIAIAVKYGAQICPTGEIFRDCRDIGRALGKP